MEGPVVQHRPQDAQALFNLVKRDVLKQPPLLERRGELCVLLATKPGTIGLRDALLRLDLRALQLHRNREAKRLLLILTSQDRVGKTINSPVN